MPDNLETGIKAVLIAEVAEKKKIKTLQARKDEIEAEVLEINKKMDLLNGGRQHWAVSKADQLYRNYCDKIIKAKATVVGQWQ